MRTKGIRVEEEGGCGCADNTRPPALPAEDIGKTQKSCIIRQQIIQQTRSRYEADKKQIRHGGFLIGRRAAGSVRDFKDSGLTLFSCLPLPAPLLNPPPIPYPPYPVPLSLKRKNTILISNLMCQVTPSYGSGTPRTCCRRDSLRCPLSMKNSRIYTEANPCLFSWQHFLHPLPFVLLYPAVLQSGDPYIAGLWSDCLWCNGLRDAGPDAGPCCSGLWGEGLHSCDPQVVPRISSPVRWG